MKSATNKIRCRSSGVEHSLGKGEVGEFKSPRQAPFSVTYTSDPSIYLYFIAIPFIVGMCFEMFLIFPHEVVWIYDRYCFGVFGLSWVALAYVGWWVATSGQRMIGIGIMIVMIIEGIIYNAVTKPKTDKPKRKRRNAAAANALQKPAR